MYLRIQPGDFPGIGETKKFKAEGQKVTVHRLSDTRFKVTLGAGKQWDQSFELFYPEQSCDGYPREKCVALIQLAQQPYCRLRYISDDLPF